MLSVAVLRSEVKKRRKEPVLRKSRMKKIETKEEEDGFRACPYPLVI